MSTPTPDDYRAALALIDTYTFTDGYDARAASDMRAVHAVARAAVAYQVAYDALCATAPNSDESKAAVAALDAASWARDAAVADLIALAKGGAS